MTWVRKDDHAALHPKVAPLDDATYRLWDEAIQWCSRNLTNGVVAPELLEHVSRRASKSRAAALVARGLWHVAGVQCGHEKCPAGPETQLGWSVPGQGWVIHDYFDYNPTAEKVLAERAAKAKRQRDYVARMAAKRDAARAATSPPSDASPDASHGPPLNGQVDPLLAFSPVPVPVPVPEGRRETGDGTDARLAEDGLAVRPEDRLPPSWLPYGPEDPAVIMATDAELRAAAAAVEADNAAHAARNHRGAEAARAALRRGAA